MDKILLVNVFGEDKPGVTNAVAESLTSFGIGVLAVSYTHLTLPTKA